MGEIIKRHKPSAVQAGKVALPRSLQVLTQLNFVALLELHNSGKRSWRVELSSKTAKFLINASDELQQLKKRFRRNVKREKSGSRLGRCSSAQLCRAYAFPATSLRFLLNLQEPVRAVVRDSER